MLSDNFVNLQVDRDDSDILISSSALHFFNKQFINNTVSTVSRWKEE